VINMPNWRVHLQTARRTGTAPTIAKRVNKLLDFPEKTLKGSPIAYMLADKRNTKGKLGHKSLHGPMGIMLAMMLFGEQAGKYALEHLIDDMWHEEMKKALGNAYYRI